jgi:NAD(P)-dependent dehydrogenase (short-subunit alcohol dehydrogenase family)
MADLRGKVMVVTGASRGIGKGIALGMGEAGATVYVTGRSTREHPGALPGTVEETAAGVTERGGHGIAARCDHRDDAQVRALFERVTREQEQLDVLVNNALASPEMRMLWGGGRFWEIPVALWDDLLDVGLRSHYVATRLAAPTMIAHGSGLVINVASHSAGTGKSAKSRVVLPYSVGKAALHRLTSDMSVELHDRGIAVLEVWPPATKIEAVLADRALFGDLSGWREPVYTGRALAALVARGEWMARSGETLVIEDLARQFGIDPAAP